MNDRSYATRHHFPEECFRGADRLIENPDFIRDYNNDVPEIRRAMIFRIAIAIGLEELERQCESLPSTPASDTVA